MGEIKFNQLDCLLNELKHHEKVLNNRNHLISDYFKSKDRIPVLNTEINEIIDRIKI